MKALLLPVVFAASAAFAQYAPPPQPPPPAAPATTSAQAEAGAPGFTAGTLGLEFGLPAGGGPTIGGSYFLNPNGALRLDLGIGASFSPSPATFAFSVEVGYRDYLATFGKLRPFFQPSLFVGETPPTGGSGNTGAFDFALEGGVGAEYFILDHFSFGIETGLSLNFASNGITAVSLSTGTTALFGELLW
ncbi:MAG: hypothetical protein ACYCWW_15455 [Deltaproteobacteria bacterium]